VVGNWLAILMLSSGRAASGCNCRDHRDCSQRYTPICIKRRSHHETTVSEVQRQW